MAHPLDELERMVLSRSAAASSRTLGTAIEELLVPPAFASKFSAAVDAELGSAESRHNWLRWRGSETAGWKNLAVGDHVVKIHLPFNFLVSALFQHACAVAGLDEGVSARIYVKHAFIPQALAKFAANALVSHHYLSIHNKDLFWIDALRGNHMVDKLKAIYGPWRIGDIEIRSPVPSVPAGATTARLVLEIDAHVIFDAAQG